MAETHDTLRCPSCHTMMQTGFLPISRGMHFIRGDGNAAHHFAEDIPGTHAIMRNNRLIAWRCKKCGLIVFRYGRDNAKTLERMLLPEEQLEPLEHEEDTDDTGKREARKR